MQGVKFGDSMQNKEVKKETIPIEPIPIWEEIHKPPIIL